MLPKTASHALKSGADDRTKTELVTASSFEGSATLRCFALTLCSRISALAPCFTPSFYRNDACAVAILTKGVPYQLSYFIPSSQQIWS